MQIDNDIAACIKVLEAGGLILYPTDTIWGIGCDGTNESAVEKIYSLKKRNTEKSMIILLADEKEIIRYIDHQRIPVFDFIKGIAKPVTVIYSQGKNLAKNLLNQDGSIGIRLVSDPFCARLINTFGKPLVSTSSNISGYPPPALFTDIDVDIKNGVDYIVQHRQNDLVPAIPSTVIKLNDDDSFTVIRS
ncbi:MAG: L-threonylcarbamoyladenylate synthase [Ferruginibacter sp.]